MDPHALDIQRRLAVAPQELTRGCEGVDVERIVRCACNDAKGYRDARGCPACEGGLRTRTEKLRVRVPPEIETGTKLRLRGKGHEALGGGAGDVLSCLPVQSSSYYAPPLLGASDFNPTRAPARRAEPSDSAGP